MSRFVARPAGPARRWIGCALAVPIIAAGAAAAGAQRLAPVALEPAPAVGAPSENPGLLFRVAAPAPPPRPWLAPIASLVLPGLGQAQLGQQRFVPYLALELYALMRYRADQRDARRLTGEYRELARRVARSAFGSVTPVGPFEYYERMRKWVESGAYDLVPGGMTEPETDTTTFNGATWLLARRTFWADPDVAPPSSSGEFAAALLFYETRAIKPVYRWSWRDAQLEQDLFRRTIARSNSAYRRASTDVGILLGNHLLSMVDALVTVRLRQRDAATQVEVRVPLPHRFDLHPPLR